MLFHSGLSPSASWRTVSTIRYMMFSNTLQKPGQLNPGHWQQLWKHSQHPEIREKLEQPRQHSEFMYLLHTSTQGTGGKVSASPNRKRICSPKFYCFHIPSLSHSCCAQQTPVETLRAGTALGPLPVPVSASQSSQKTLSPLLLPPLPLHT